MVNHKNGIRTDNRVDNLEWLLPADNERHARSVLGKRCLGEKASRSKLKSEQVLKIRELMASGQTERKVANQFGISTAQVGRIARRTNWGHI